MSDRGAWGALLLGAAALAGSWGSRGDAAMVLPLRPALGTRLDAPLEKPAADAASGTAPVTLIDGVPFLDFGAFLFKDYDAPALRNPPNVPLGPSDCPEAVTGYHGQQVVVEGYVLAADMKEGRVESLILARFPPGCCFGSMPVIDEWMAVDLLDGGSEPFSTFTPVMIQGTLDLGERIDERGEAESLYRLHGGRVVRGG